jgi:hypothetical protein
MKNLIKHTCGEEHQQKKTTLERNLMNLKLTKKCSVNDKSVISSWIEGL